MALPVAAIFYNREKNKFLNCQRYMKVLFEEDLRESIQIHLEEWKKRPFTDRVKKMVRKFVGPLVMNNLLLKIIKGLLYVF